MVYTQSIFKFHIKGIIILKTFCVNIDDTLYKNLENLKKSMGKSSKAEVFRLAIAFLAMAKEAKEEGLKVVFSDVNDIVKKEILIP